MRPPRVQITYDVETLGSFETKEIPFVLGIIADLAGATQLEPFYKRRFILIDGGNFDDVLSSVAPTLGITLDGEEIALKFAKFSDFSPDSIVQAVPPLQLLLSRRVTLVDLVGKLDGNVALNKALLAGDDVEIKKILGDRGDEILSAFAEIDDAEKTSKPYQVVIKEIVNLDKQLSEKLDLVLHNPDYMKLSTAWLGLRYLVTNTPSNAKLKLKVLIASRDEIEKDMDSVASFDTSNLFKKVYEEEYGTPGGEPYSCLVVDEYFGRSNSDIEYARRLTEVACASHAPIITGTSPLMFGLESFQDLGKINDLHKVFESSEAAKFNGLRESDSSCYISFAMPRVMLRAPYHHLDNPIKSFRYAETISEDNHLCWGNAAYSVAGRVVEAYVLHGWTAAIRGVEGGGLVENLPSYVFKTEHGDVVMKCPTEIAITDRRERELSDLGFLTLCHIKDSDKAVLFGAQTAQKPKKYLSKDATANALLSVRLPYVMNCSRFAHYIKVMMRDKIGTVMTGADIEFFLQNWLGQYVLLSDEGSVTIKAQKPLREGLVSVTADEERPGSYRAVLHLRPHFQMEDLGVSIRLVAKIPELLA
jgi:type VI secretion system protein ImpC